MELGLVNEAGRLNPDVCRRGAGENGGHLRAVERDVRKLFLASLEDLGHAPFGRARGAEREDVGDAVPEGVDRGIAELVVERERREDVPPVARESLEVEVAVDPVGIMCGRGGNRCRGATRAGEGFAPHLWVEVGPFVEGEHGEVMKWSGRGEIEVGDEPFVFTISLIFRAVAEGHVRGGVQRSVDCGGEGIAQLTVEEEPPLPLVGRRVGGTVVPEPA